MNIRSYNHRNIDELWCMINNSINCLDIIILSESWNSTGFIPQDIKGFSHYKSINDFNHDGVLVYTNNRLNRYHNVHI